MTLKEYADQIALLIREGHGSKTVVFSCDEEGNCYDDLYYKPSVMAVKDIKDLYRGQTKKGDVVCIN